MNYKILFFIIFPSALIFIPACDERTPLEYKMVNSDEPFELKIGQSALIDNGKIVLKFQSVPLDSRCFEGSICGDSADAVAAVKIFKNDYSFHTNLYPQAAIINDRYIELISLFPYLYRGSQMYRSSYSAKFIVLRARYGNI
jgi:hypothetical protein